MRDAWTDERLDDLARRMDAGFERVDRDIREVGTEIREVRTEVRDLGKEMNSRFDGVAGSIETLQRTLIQVAGGLGAVLLASILASHL